MNMPDHLDSETLRLISLSAYDLKYHPDRGYCFTGYALEDIEMDLTLHLLERLKSFDPAKGSWTRFVRARLWQKSADMIRKAHTYTAIERRKTTVQIDKPVFHEENGDPVTLAETIPDPSKDKIDELIARIDFDECLEGAEPELQTAARLLSVYTQEETAAFMEYSRATFQRRVLPEVRRLFAVRAEAAKVAH